MSLQITPQDWEALSAYLDDELNSKEKSRLEARMSENQALRDALQQLRRTRVALRQTPRLRAPRHFTLTPEMAGIKPRAERPNLLAAFRLAFAMASILFALVFAGDLTNTLPANIAIAPQVEQIESAGQPEQAPAMEAEAEGEALELAEESAPAEESAEEEPQISMFAQESVEEEAADRQMDATSEGIGGGESEMMTQATEEGAMAVAATATEIPPTATPIPEPTPTPQPQAPAPPPKRQLPLWLIEAILATLAIASGLGVIFLRGKR